MSCIPGSIGAKFSSIRRVLLQTRKRKAFPELPYLTVRLGYMACDYFNADTGLAMVRPDHQAFYRRVFLHETIAEPRPFPGWHRCRRIDGVRFPDSPGKGPGALSDHAIECFRAADAVRSRPPSDSRADAAVHPRASRRHCRSPERNSVAVPVPRCRRLWASAVTGYPRPARFEGQAVVDRLAFTLAPHLQLINHRGCFSPFVGI